MYRREVWNVFRKYNKPDSQVLLLPSIEGLEIELAKAKGFCTSNMHVVDYNPAIVAHLKRRYPYVNTYGVSAARACERIAKTGKRLLAANFDFTGCISAATVKEITQITESQVFAPVSCIAVNLLRGREPKCVSSFWTAVLQFQKKHCPQDRWLTNATDTLFECSSDLEGLTENDLVRIQMMVSLFNAGRIARAGVYKSANGTQTMLWAVLIRVDESVLMADTPEAERAGIRQIFRAWRIHREMINYSVTHAIDWTQPMSYYAFLAENSDRISEEDRAWIQSLKSECRSDGGQP